MINIAALNQIIIFALPPHTTHVTQPLDRACFAPLKIEWRQLCHKYISENPGKTVSQYEFCELFSKAWSRAFTIKTIVSSFKVTGVFPFNRPVIATHFLDKKESEENFSLFKPDILAQKTGLAYIPLYSPSVRRSKQAMITSTPRQCSHDTALDDSCFDTSGLRHATSIMERSYSDSNLYERHF